MPGAGRRKDKRRRLSGGEFGSRKRKKHRHVILIWSIVFAVTALGVIGAAVFLSMKDGGKGDASTSHTTGKGVRVESRFPSPSEAEALALVKNALLARDPVAVEKYFRLDGVTPAAVVLFLEGMTRHDGPVTGYRWIGSMDKNGLLIDAVAILSQAGESVKSRTALLTPDEKGVWKIDFHSFARTCVPAWVEVGKEDSKGGRVRAFLREDSYYNSFFTDEETWACYELWSPDSKETLLGYCRVDSPQHEALDRILRRHAATGVTITPPQAYLEIRRVEGAEVRQFEITRVFAEGWVMSDTPFDERSP